MNVYRSPMEKILKQMEDNEVINDPKRHIRSLAHKIAYRCAWHADRLHRLVWNICHRQPRT